MLFKRGASNAQALDEASAQQQASRASLALSQARLDKTRILAPLRWRGWAYRVRSAPAITSATVRTSSTWKCSTRSRSISAFRRKPSARSASSKLIEVSLDAYPGERFSGEIFAINPRLDEAGRSQAIRAHISNQRWPPEPGAVRARFGDPSPSGRTPW